MPRGKRNNPNLPTFQQEDGEQVRKILSSMLPEWLQEDDKQLDTRNPEQVKRKITEYFISCQQNGLRPMLVGMLSVLGIKYKDYANNTAELKRVTSDESIEIIKKGHKFIASYLEQIATTGHLNPPVAIFLMKNYIGLTDVQSIELTPKQDITATQTAEQIAESIPLEIEQNDDTQP